MTGISKAPLSVGDGFLFPSREPIGTYRRIANKLSYDKKAFPPQIKKLRVGMVGKQVLYLFRPTPAWTQIKRQAISRVAC